jgi:hypothetical protein
MIIMKNEKLSIVTEVGTFGDLNIQDPTSKETEKLNNDSPDDIEEIIKQSIEKNKSINI